MVNSVFATFVALVILAAPKVYADDGLAIKDYYGLSSGMIVFEVGNGDGYFTEIVSNAIGPDGRVFTHYTRDSWREGQDDFTGKFAERNNIVPFIGDAVKFGIPDQSVDVVMVSLTWHDFDGKGARPFLANSLRLLKPGGVLAIVESVGLVRQETIDGIKAAGFEYLGGRNTVERSDHAKHYALKFRKPSLKPASR